MSLIKLFKKTNKALKYLSLNFLLIKGASYSNKGSLLTRLELEKNHLQRYYYKYTILNTI